MNYEDEKFIKVYTRDTAAWLALPWQCRGLMLEISRKMPQLTGELSLGRKGLETLAALLRADWAEIEPFIRELIADGRIVYDEEQQLIRDPQHVERQTAIASTARRSQDYRERVQATKPQRKPRKTKEKVAVTQRHADATQHHAESLLDETRLDQTRTDESENARARELPSDGVVRSDLPLLDDARAKYDTIAAMRRLDTPVEDTWLAFCGHHAGALFGGRDGIMGKFQKWLIDQAKRDEKERHARREREDREAKRDATFAARFPPKSDVAPMTPYKLRTRADDTPEPTAAERAEAQRLAAAAGLSFLDSAAANDTPKPTGTDE